MALHVFFLFINFLITLEQVMEKIRPIDHKLRYQVDKLIRAATSSLAGWCSVYSGSGDYWSDKQVHYRHQSGSKMCSDA